MPGMKPSYLPPAGLRAAALGRQWKGCCSRKQPVQSGGHHKPCWALTAKTMGGTLWTPGMEDRRDEGWVWFLPRGQEEDRRDEGLGLVSPQG